MNVLFITILFLVILICIFTVFFILIYNNFQDSIIRINEVEGKIDECLRKKYDLLNRSVTIVKGNIKVKSEIFDEVVRLRSRKINNFDLERKLVNGYQELLKVKNEKKELESSEEINKIIPSNIIASICKYKEKVFFDKKDMTDDDINDFKL